MSDVQEDVTLMAHIRAVDEGASAVLGNVKAAAGGLGAGLLTMYQQAVGNAMSYSDAVQKVSFLTGQSAEKSSGLISAFRAQGFTTDEAANSMQRLTMRLGAIDTQMKTTGKVSAQSANTLKELGLSADDLTRSGGDLTQLMPKIIDHLRTMHDPLERDRIAMQLFGRNFSSIAPLIEAGGAAFSKATGDAKRFGVELTDKQMAAISNYQSAIETTKEAVQGLSLKIAFQALPVFQKMQDMVKEGIEWWNKLSPSVHHTALEIVKLTAIFGTLLGGAAALNGPILGILRGIPGIGAAAEMVLPKLAAFLGPIGALAALFFALKYAFDHNAEAHRILLPLVNGLRDAFFKVKEAVEFFFNSAAKIGPIGALMGSLKILGVHTSTLIVLGQTLQGAWEGLQDAARKILPPLMDMVKTVGAELRPAFEKIAAAVLPALRAAMVQLFPIIEQLGHIFKEQIIPIVLDVIEILKVVLPPAIRFLAEVLSFALPIAIKVVVIAIKLFIDSFGMMFTIIKDVLDIIVDLVHGNWGKAWEDFKRLGMDALHGFIRILTDAWEGIKGIFGKAASIVWGVVTTTWNNIVSSVRSFGTGIINAITGTWNRLVGGVEATWHEFARRPIYWITFLVASVVMWIVNLEVQIGLKFIELAGRAAVFGFNFYTGVVSWIQQLPGRVLGFLASTAAFVAQQAPILIARAIAMGTGFLAGMINEIVKLPGQVGNHINAVGTSVSAQAPGIIARGLKMAQDFIGAILGALAALPGRVAAIVGAAFGNAAGQARQALHDAHVPGFAQGAVVGPGFGGARMAVVGEGNEAEVIAKASSLIKAGMQAATGGGGGGFGGGNITIEYHVDGRLIEKRTSKITGKRMRLQGAGSGSSA